LIVPTVLSCGPRAVLLEFASLDEVISADAVLSASDLVAGGREVEGDGAADLSPSEQPAALEGAGVEADEPAAEPAEGAEGAGVARDRGAMLRLFSAIRDL